MKRISIGVVFIVFIFFLGACCKREYQQKSASKQKWHWDNPEKQSRSAGYAQVVKSGNTLYISGIPTSNMTAEGVKQLYESLAQSLQAFGATSANIVKETIYTTDIEKMKELNDIRKVFYEGDFPASTWVQVSRLYEPSAMLEVDLIAIIE